MYRESSRQCTSSRTAYRFVVLSPPTRRPPSAMSSGDMLNGRSGSLVRKFAYETEESTARGPARRLPGDNRHFGLARIGSAGAE